MALQYSDTLRDAKLAQIESTVGTTPKLQLRSGTVPANCAAADSGTLLAEFDLPTDWMNAPSGGVVTKLGTWQDVGIAAGTIGHFRVKNAAGTVTHVQGTVTATGGGGDMTVDNTSIAVDQQVTVTTFTITDNNG